MKRKFFLPLFFVVIASCTKAQQENSVGNAVSLPSAVNKAILLQLVNAVRKSGCNCGSEHFDAAPAITWNNQLEDASFAHSNDMFQNKYFSHTGSDGSNAGERISKTGYKWSTYGENIASGYKNEQEVVAGWLSSTGHCKNIMNKNYREMGVAKVGNLWTQELATKK